ncbi:SCO family protein [Daejeonella sp.]|uniref:SCO family protein n=1 Tax=Daejeonella sp. TaxID=2805397 RepID=UPI003983CAB2
MQNEFLTGIVYSQQRLPYWRQTLSIKPMSLGYLNYNEASFTPLWSLDKIGPGKLHTIAPFRMINQSNDAITEKNLKGKITLVNFFFTACQSVCPKMKNTMKKVHSNFEDNSRVLFLSYSVTPENDTVEKLAEYARSNGIPGKQWNLLTGDKTEIYKLARKSYFIEEEPGLSKSVRQFLHTENLVLIDGEGHIRGLYNGTLEAEEPRISEDILGLLKDL